MTLTRRTALFAAWCAGLALVHLVVLQQWLQYSRSDDSASHVVLIPLVSLVLVWWDRDRVFAAPAFAPGPGLAIGTAGVALALAARAAVRGDGAVGPLSAAVAALLVLWVAAFVGVYGVRAAREALFPLLFLVFAIPIPEGVLNAAVQALKNGSADSVAALFTLTGTPYLRESFVFHLPTIAIEVADACSGIRSSIALVLTGLLIGHLYLDSVWKRVVLMLVILPLTILKNGIRIVALSLLAMHVDPSFLTGQLHHDGGIVFFLIALAMLAPVVVLLSRRRAAVRQVPAV